MSNLLQINRSSMGIFSSNKTSSGACLISLLFFKIFLKIFSSRGEIHSLAKLLARQARPGTTQDGSGNEAENYSSILATNQHQL